MVSAAKRLRQEEETKRIVDLCEANDIDYVFIAPYQIRLNDRLDVYPQGQKYFYLPKRRWGTYEDISKLVDDIEEEESE